MIIETKKGTIKVTINDNKSVIKTDDNNVLLFSEEWYLTPDNKIKSNTIIPLFVEKGMLLGVSLELKSGLIFIVNPHCEEAFKTNKDEILFYLEKNNMIDIIYDDGGILEWRSE